MMMMMIIIDDVSNHRQQDRKRWKKSGQIVDTFMGDDGGWSKQHNNQKISKWSKLVEEEEKI